MRQPIMNRAIRMCLGLSLAMGAAAFSVYAVLGWVVTASTGTAASPALFFALIAIAFVCGLLLAAWPEPS